MSLPTQGDAHDLSAGNIETHGLSELGGSFLEGEYPAFGLISLLVLTSFVFLWLSFLYVLADHYPGDKIAAFAAAVLIPVLNFTALWRYREEKNKNNLFSALLVISSSFLGPVLFYALASQSGVLVHASVGACDEREFTAISLGLASVSFVLAVLWKFPALSSLTVVGLFGLWLSRLCIYSPEGQDFKLACLVFGLATCLVGCLIAYIPTANYKYWVNKLGLALVAFGLAFFWRKDGIDAPYILIALSLLLAAVFFRYPSFAATGLLALVVYVNVQFSKLLQPGSVWFPIVLFAQAALLFLGAIYIPRWAKRERVGKIFKLVERLQPRENTASPFQFLRR
jgi:MFS family permease